MCILTCRVDKDINHFDTLQKRGNLVKQWMRTFVNRDIELYIPSFAVHNTHNLIHLADDYMPLGLNEQYNAFKYESFLGYLKKLVTGPCKPSTQVVNKY